MSTQPQPCLVGKTASSGCCGISICLSITRSETALSEGIPLTFNCRQDSAKVIIDKDDICYFLGYICPALPHRHSNISHLQCRRIIHLSKTAIIKPHPAEQNKAKTHFHAILCLGVVLTNTLTFPILSFNCSFII